MVKGIAREIAAASVEVSPEKWHTLALHADGDQFSASFDDKNLFAAQDGTLLKIGLVALWTKADSVARFDALKIRSVP
jgi:hypothetical protein